MSTQEEAEKRGKKGEQVEAKINITDSTNIHFEAPKQFSKSIALDTYIRAFDMVKEIVNGNKKRISESNMDASERRTLEQLYNIITFTGERGVGKTSAMLSFMEFLKDYCRSLDNNEWGIPTELRDVQMRVMFTGIEYIDASLLEKKESILGSVLAKMLNKWQKEESAAKRGRGLSINDNYDYRKRQLQRQFGKVYECLRILRDDKNLMSEENDLYIDTLQKLSMSENLKQSFQELVNSYLNIMEYSGSSFKTERGNHFLVISIDDLDLNINNGYNLLEDIRKYLMIPNVIVLMTVNGRQLEKICLEYYMKEFSQIKNLDANIAYCKKTVQEYIEKITPDHRCVRLLSGSDWKYFNDTILTITVNDKKFAYGTLKKIVQEKYEADLKMLFDIDGSTLDYLTAYSIRQLTEWVRAIQALEQINDAEKKLQAFYAWFWETEFTRICNKYLSDAYNDEILLLKNLIKAEISVQLMAIKDIIVHECGRNNYKGFEEELDSFESLNRIYIGDIYSLIAQIEAKYSRSKDLLAIIKIFLVAQLSECLARGKYILVQEYYGFSVWGSWEKTLINPICVSADAEKNTYKVVSIGQIKFASNKNPLSCTINMELKNDWTSFKEKEGDNKETESVLKYHQWLLLFYSGFNQIPPYLGDEHLWRISEGRESGNAKIIRFEVPDKIQILFSISSFVVNYLTGSSAIVESFVSSFAEFLHNQYPSVPEDDIESFVKSRYSILDDPTWSVRELLPLQDVDFLIGAGRKLQKEMRQVLLGESPDENIKNMYKRFFNLLLQCLKDNDKQHSEKYAQRLNENPVVSAICNSEGDESFLIHLVDNIKAISTDYSYIVNDSTWTGEN